MKFTTRVKLEWRLRKYITLAIVVLGIALMCLANKEQFEEINNYPLQSLDTIQVME